MKKKKKKRLSKNPHTGGVCTGYCTPDLDGAGNPVNKNKTQGSHSSSFRLHRQVIFLLLLLIVVVLVPFYPVCRLLLLLSPAMVSLLPHPPPSPPYVVCCISMIGCMGMIRLA